MKSFIKYLFTVACFSVFFSCERDRINDSVASAPEPSFSLEQILPESVDTKSVNLKGMDFDAKKSVTLAAYTGGYLYTAGYYTTSLSAMKLNLESGKTYTIYALVNMGDKRSSLPQQESGLSNFVFELTDQSLSLTNSSSLKTMGMPMSGSLSYTVGTSTSSVIPVTRLFAKVYVDLEFHLAGLTSSSFGQTKVYNLNRKLKPFNTTTGSVATSSSDLYSVYDYSNGSSSDETGTSRSFSGGVASARLILYVPENRQGTISGISSSRDKNMDLNASVAAKSNVLSYIETNVTIPTGSSYSGSVVYRSYLGNNATNNFDIVRNKEYNWKIKYYDDGLQYNDWKVVTEGMLFQRDRYEFDVQSISLKGVRPTSYYGSSHYFYTVNNATSSRKTDSHDFQITKYTDTYRRVGDTEVFQTAGTTGTVMSPDLFTWGFVSETGTDDGIVVIGSTSNNTKNVAAQYHGKGQLVATLSSDNTKSASCEVTVIGTEFSYTVSPNPVVTFVSGTNGVGVNYVANLLYYNGNSQVATDSEWNSLTGSHFREGAFDTYAFYKNQCSIANTSYAVVQGSSNTSPAVIRGVAAGTTTLTATITNGSKYVCTYGSYNTSDGLYNNSFNVAVIVGNATFELRIDDMYLNPGENGYDNDWAKAYAGLWAHVSKPGGGTEDIFVKNATNDVNSAGTWASSNTSVATINASNGYVTALTPGVCQISGSATFYNLTGNYTYLTLSDIGIVNVSSTNYLTLTPNPCNLVVGHTQTMSVDHNGSTINNSSCTWSSSNTSIATVNANGVVTGVSPGTVTITAQQGSLFGLATVIVTQDTNTYSIFLSPASSTIYVGNTQQLTAYLVVNGNTAGATPISATDCTWSSSNTSKATVNASGLVSGVAAGSATITANYNGMSATASVTVQAVPADPVITYELLLSTQTIGNNNSLNTLASIKVGNTHQLHVKLIKKSDGVVVETKSSDGTGSGYIGLNSFNWAKVPASATNISVTNGVVTGVSVTSSAIQVKATLKSDTSVVSNNVSITVIDNSGIDVESGWDDDPGGTIILN